MGVDLEGAGDEAEGPREQLLGAIEVAGDVSDMREVEEDGSDVAVVGAAGSAAVATRRCPLKALRLRVLQVAQEGRQLQGSTRRISQFPLHDQITNRITLLDSLPFDPGWLRLPQFVTEFDTLARRRLYGYGLLNITLIKRDANLHVSVLPDNSPRNVTSIPDDLHGEVARGLSRVALPLDSPAMPDLAPRRHVDGNLSVIGLQ